MKLLLFILVKFHSQAFAIGYKPKYIPISKCASSAKLLIMEMHIDINKIHSCSVKKEEALNYKEKVRVVELSYGDSDDCPAGCIYKKYTAIVEGDGQQGQFIQVPERTTSFNPSIFPEFTDRFRLKDFNCPQSIGKFTRTTYGKNGKQWGLFFELKKPYVCTWIKTVSTKYPKDYRHSFNEGYKMKGEWTGHVFYKSHPMGGHNNNVTYHPTIKFQESQLDFLKWEEVN